jgi:hypothetical protein
VWRLSQRDLAHAIYRYLTEAKNNKIAPPTNLGTNRVRGQRVNTIPRSIAPQNKDRLGLELY